MSSDTDDSPYYIPTRTPPIRPPSPLPPPSPVVTATSSAVPAIHIHLSAPTESSPVAPRPWYFTGSGVLWLLFAGAVLAGAGYLALQFLAAKGWL